MGQSDEATTALPEDEPKIIICEEVKSCYQSGSQTQRGLRVVEKLKLNKLGMTSDEIELSSFLQSRHVLSKNEKNYLLKYVVKGIPDSLRGRVKIY